MGTSVLQGLFGVSRVQRTAHWLVRLVGMVYLIALVPFTFQIKGLMGSEGLLPAANLLKTAFSNEGWLAWLHFPSLFWLFPTDTMLLVLVLLGCVGALGMILYLLPHISSLIAWVCFVSILTIGGDFTIIIIDVFLAEVGFLVVLTAFCFRYLGYLPYLIAFLLKLLLFRLWFSMGMVKFYHPGESWVNFTFFSYFFPNQPMPTPLAWYFHKLPQTWFSFTIVVTFLVEMIVPFFVFGVRIFRFIALLSFTAITLLIMLSGNYGYFNVLSIVLSVVLLHDNDFGSRFNNSELVPYRFDGGRVRKVVGSFVLVLGLFVGSMQMVYFLFLFNPRMCNPQNHLCYPFYFEGSKQLPTVLHWVNSVYRVGANFRLSSPYGVFKDMTRFRVELRFEGSRDGVIWSPYTFNYVPSGVNQKLRFFAPYYPRIDHVMYYESIGVGAYNASPIPPFTAPQNLLNPYYTVDNAWICRFIEALRSQNLAVLSLLGENPFPGKPPEYLRVEVYALRFSTEAEKEATGKWWMEKQMFTAYNSADGTDCKPMVELQDLYSRYAHGDFEF